MENQVERRRWSRFVGDGGAASRFVRWTAALLVIALGAAVFQMRQTVVQGEGSVASTSDSRATTKPTDERPPVAGHGRASFSAELATRAFSKEHFFRKPDMAMPLTEPPVVDAESAPLDPDSEVIGVVIRGNPRAYSVRALSYHHVINDQIAGVPVLVTYCGISSSGTVFDPTLDGQRAYFAVHGAWQGTSISYDETTRSIWLQLSGECIEGRLRGQRLNPFPSRHALWEEWKRDHPDTGVVVGNVHDPNYETKEQVQRGCPLVPQAFRKSMVLSDRRYPSNELVYGIARVQDPRTGHEVTKAYPLSELARTGRVVNDLVGGTPVVIVLNEKTRSTLGFSRRMGKQLLEFEADESGRLRDKDSGAVFSDDGVCLEGKYKGQSLPNVFGVQAEWYAWSAVYPDTAVYQAAAHQKS